jgi:hypothetical protein
MVIDFISRHLKELPHGVNVLGFLAFIVFAYYTKDLMSLFSLLEGDGFNDVDMAVWTKGDVEPLHYCRGPLG